MNCDEWIVKYHSVFEDNLKGKSKRLLTSLDREIELLRKNPYIGKNLGPKKPWIWKINVEIRFRLYYQIWERKCIIYLLAFYPRNLQKRFLEGRIP